jgi:hypothetical protein
LPILEHQQRWNAANIVASRGIHRFVDVQLGHFQLARVVVGNFGHRGRQHVARAAPFGPEIHHDRLGVAGRQYFCFKVSIGNRQNVVVVSHIVCP